MPDLDLDPGEYIERKPKGWRWRLPWSSPEGARLPAAMLIVAGGFSWYFFANMGSNPSPWVVAAGAMFSACAGMMLMLALRD